MTVLRPYQTKNVNEILACLERGEDPLYVLPTGGGKTTVFTSVIGTTLSQGWESCVFVHRKELLRQASARLTAEGIEHGVIMPGFDLTSHKVHVASIDTVGARFDSLSHWLERLDLAIPDEAHHSVANKWDRVLQLPQRRFGNTATPCRTDGMGLGETGLFKRMIRGPSPKELIKMGFLAPGIVYAPPTGLDLSKVGKRGGDYVLSQIAALTDTDELTLIARRWYAKMCPGQPAVVFCTTVEHAKRVAQAFAAAGWRAASVDGKMSPAERDAAIIGLADGLVQVLTSCELIGEGLDIPAVSAVIDLRPSISTGLVLQHDGRAARPHEDKSHWTKIDLVGNTARHGMFDADRQWDLRSGIRGLERVVAATWRCRKCFRVWERPDQFSAMSCTCGSTQTVSGIAPARVDVMPGINGVSADTLHRMKLKDAVKVCKTLDDYKSLGRIKGYKPGWATYAYEQVISYRARFKRRAY
ncbi:DEAD/DEAH box helicase [Telmatospirillum sp.]|uniref:DEAD/DEAH box helicase n=1 Tax=Telmatospirillum sp. TaxID=2079197 RepID=UPI002842407B|nr:DEAD/DEAH box helicase [Telmatospirillum sp.]MDR3439865.1 DEAD/DEAH box helicase [Telmatospirillum sp.]